MTAITRDAGWPVGLDVEALHGRRATDPVHRMVVGDVLERLTWSRPDTEALVGRLGAYGDPAFARLTYAAVDRLANQVAHALLGAGLERSARVLLYCENSVEAVVTMIGIAKAGLVCVPVNPLLAPDVLVSAIEHVEPTFAVVDAELWSVGQGPFERAGLAPAVTITVGGDAVPGTVSFTDWVAGRPESAPDPEPALHADDIWILLFTSGTTALPKAAMCSHTYSYLAAFSYVGPLTRGVRHEHDLVLATFLPIVYHCGHNAGVLPGFFTGGTVVLGRRFDPAAVCAAITEERVTALWGGAPRFLALMAAAAQADPAVDLTSLRIAMFSWGAMHGDVARRLRAVCGDELLLLEVFGQSEAMSCFRFWLDEHPEKVEASGGVVNHVGVPNPVLAADVHTADGESLRGVPGVPGEAVYRSPVVAAGYYRNAEATAQTFRDGWFRSGDSCAYEPDGEQTLVDRYKDVIKTGGENVASVRVEAVLDQHPDVARSAVIGVPDPHWGEMVVAVVVAADGRTPDPATLIAFCRERLAGYETPKRVEFVDVFPETVGAKILKYRLRERFAAGGC